MNRASIIDPSLMEIDMDLDTKEDVLQKMASNLVREGYVNETYIEAILKREKAFPTGISTEGLGVAIPHTDIEHVIRPAVAVATLKEPVKFFSMEDPETEVDVKIVFMLAITEPEFQLDILRKLVSLFQNKEMLIELSKVEDAEEMAVVLDRVIDIGKVSG
ncbi:MAG TPA: PTS sugar transporter subunit IIA [Tepidimicrobium sp.]|nr:PTS sugar transporter subunit IIA [Tepidimicrobium sp.]